MGPAQAVDCAKSKLSVERPVFLLALSCFVFLIGDCLIYRSGFFARHILPPYGSEVLAPLVRAVKRDEDPKRDKVIILGDSELNKALDLNSLRSHISDLPFQVQELAPAGGTAKSWYYMLKELDPNRDKYKVVILALGNYKGESFFEDPLSYDELAGILGILKPGGWPAFEKDEESDSFRRLIPILCLFPSHIYASNLQDFLVHPLARTESIKAFDRDPFRNYSRVMRLSDIRLDAMGHVMACPSNKDKWCSKSADRLQIPPIAEAREKSRIYHEYSKKWVNRILDYYRGSSTRVVFMQMPRGPGWRTRRTPLADAPDIRDAVPGEDKFRFTDANYFARLERPDLFADTDHLNKEGSAKFTALLADYLRAHTDEFDGSPG